MTNDERNPKLECRRAFICLFASFVRELLHTTTSTKNKWRSTAALYYQTRPVSSLGFRHSFGFCHSSFGFGIASSSTHPGRPPGPVGEAVHGFSLAHSGGFLSRNSVSPAF